MARQPLDPPSHFGKLVSSAIRREIGDIRMSGRSLATVLGKSEAYVRERLKDKYEFTLADVERFALYLTQRPEEFIGSIERREMIKDWPDDERPMTSSEMREFTDELARRRAGRNVPGPAEDEEQLPAVARQAETEPTDET